MTSEDNTAKRGVLVAAENGPAIEFDETGLVLHLSDRVVADLARRLGKDAPGHEHSDASGGAAATGELTRLDAAILGDIDAWDVTRTGEWLGFSARLPGEEGPRRYLRHAEGGGIIAETAGALLCLPGIGGGRHATTWSGAPRFPHHAIASPAPCEDEPDRPVVNLRNRSGCTELADALLDVRHREYRALPLIATGHELLPPGRFPVPGPVLSSVAAGLDRIIGLSVSLGKKARILALRIELGHDQAPEDADAFHRGAMGFLDALADLVSARRLGTLRFLAVADCGAWWQHDPASNRAAMEGTHRLILRPGPHELVIAAPGYMFAQDDLGQPTEAAAAERADMEMHALEAASERSAWVCPLLCLAEREGDLFRATFKAAGALTIDPADPFGAGPNAGFALAGTSAGIVSVEIAPDDSRSVLIRSDGPLLPNGKEGGLRLDYAIGGRPRDPSGEVFYPAACGALRDDWEAEARTGRTLHRWALPGSVEIR